MRGHLESRQAGLAGLLLLAVAGCTSGGTTTAVALQGPTELVAIDHPFPDGGETWQGRFVFVTSTATSDLRVLDLSPAPLAVNSVEVNAIRRAFLQGPNPLEALSVPAVERPTALTAFHFVQEGAFRTGPYLVARKAGSGELSLVSVGPAAYKASRDTLRPVEVRRLLAPHPVTASAGVWLPGRDEGLLYVATYDGQRTEVLEYRIPGSEAQLRATPVLPARVVAAAPGQVATAMSIVPPAARRWVDGTTEPCGAESCLLVALREDLGRAGTAVLLVPSSGRVAPVDFGGPVRALAVNPASRALPAGARAFALLDEEACELASCGGLVAVDLLDGSPGAFRLVRDAAGLPTRPLGTGQGLPLGLAVGGDPQRVPFLANVTDGDGGVSQEVGLLGLVLGSAGTMTFFDGEKLTWVDADTRRTRLGRAGRLPPGGGNASDFAVEELGDTEAGTTRFRVSFTGDGPTPFELTLKDGSYVTADEVISVVRGGLLPGALGVQLPADGGLLVPVEQPGVFLPGDVADVLAGGEPCDAIPVEAVTDSAVLLSRPVAPSCPAGRSLSFRAGEPQDLLVFSSVRGYLGRGATGATAAFRWEPAFYPSGVPEDLPALTVRFGSLAPGAEADFAVQSNATAGPLAFEPQGVSCGGSPPGLLPGPALYDAVRRRFFAVFPVSSGILEIRPDRLTGRVGASAVVCHR